MEVSDLFGDFIGVSITDNGVHGSPIPDIVSQGVDDLLGALDTICITYQGVSATAKIGPWWIDQQWLEYQRRLCQWQQNHFA